MISIKYAPNTKVTPQPALPFSGMCKLPDFKVYKSLPSGRLLYIDINLADGEADTP